MLRKKLAKFGFFCKKKKNIRKVGEFSICLKGEIEESFFFLLKIHILRENKQNLSVYVVTKLL